MGNFKSIPTKLGLKDGGHIILCCSACGERLVDVWLIKVDAKDPSTGQPLKSKGKAKCWKCGDESFPAEWRGRWALGAFGEDVVNSDPTGANDSKITTKTVRIDTAGDMLIFSTMKGD